MNKDQKKKIIKVLKDAKTNALINERVHDSLISLIKEKIDNKEIIEMATDKLSKQISNGVKVIDAIPKELNKNIESQAKDTSKIKKESKETNKYLRIISAKDTKKELVDIKNEIKDGNNRGIKALQDVMISLFNSMLTFLSKATFKVQPTAKSFETPQLVTFYDPKTGSVVSPTDLIPKRAVTNVYVPVNEVNQTINNSLDQYKVCDVDDSSTPKYYGFADKDENWYILRDNGSGQYRYAKGSGSYTTAWTDRATQNYDYFYNVF